MVNPSGMRYPRFLWGAAVFASNAVLTTAALLLVVPIDRAASRAATMPVIVSLIPVFLGIAVHVLVWFTVAAAIVAWARYRAADEPTATFRTSLSLVGIGYLPLTIFAVLTIVAAVNGLVSFNSELGIRSPSGASRVAIDSLSWPGRMRPWAWLLAGATIVFVAARSERSWRRGLVLVGPPLLFLVFCLLGLEIVLL